MELADNFDALADMEMWADVAAIGGGYMGASLAQATLESSMPFDMPNEGYGVGVAAAGVYVDMDYSNEVAMGGGLYTLDALAQRANLKQRVTSMGGN